MVAFHEFTVITIITVRYREFRIITLTMDAPATLREPFQALPSLLPTPENFARLEKGGDEREEKLENSHWSRTPVSLILKWRWLLPTMRRAFTSGGMIFPPPPTPPQPLSSNSLPLRLLTRISPHLPLLPHTFSLSPSCPPYLYTLAFV